MTIFVARQEGPEHEGRFPTSVFIAERASRDDERMTDIVNLGGKNGSFNQTMSDQQIKDCWRICIRSSKFSVLIRSSR